MTDLEKVRNMIEKHGMKELLLENRADMMPFFDVSFETLLSGGKGKEEFLSILDSTLIRYGIPGELKQTVWNQIAFLLFTLTAAGDEVPEIGSLVNDVPGYVLIESAREFLDRHTSSAPDADNDLVMKWSYLLRMLYVLAYSAEPLIEYGLGIVTMSMEISDLWYGAGAWEEVIRIGDTTLEFAEALWKSGNLPAHFAVMIGILWYQRGAALKNGRGDEYGQKEAYGKALPYLEEHGHGEDEELEAVIADIRKTLGRK